MMICEEADTISTMSERWKREGRFSTDYKWNKEFQVPVTTLDNVIREYGLPKLCKIDVEGFEYTLLKGLTRPIPYICFEFTREFFDDAKKCIEYLLTLGHAEFNCSIGESCEFLFERWVSTEELYRRIGSIEDDLLWGDIYVKFL